jgi:diguanylate cyclase (GGDEF)-like protein
VRKSESRQDKRAKPIGTPTPRATSPERRLHEHAEAEAPARLPRSTAMRLAAEVERLERELAAARAQMSALEARADIDPLTDVLNRRGFERELKRSLAYVKRHGTGAALVYVDLDDFKSVNDRIGHLAGDAVLAQVAERLRNSIRSVDVGCRVGGDEFAVIMPESTAEDATQLFQRMHDSVATVSVPGGGRVRISAGIAELRHGETAAGLFERADSALYQAKDLGKDRASVAAD